MAPFDAKVATGRFDIKPHSSLLQEWSSIMTWEDLASFASLIIGFFLSLVLSYVKDRLN